MPSRAALLLLLTPLLTAQPPAQSPSAQGPATRASQRSPDELFAKSRAARAGGRYAMLLRQFAADEGELKSPFEAGQRPALASYQKERDIPAGHWVWVRPYWFVFRDGPDAAPCARSWGPEQACGEPDTPNPGDCSTAWATREEDRADEWLLLEYARPIQGTVVEIHETYHPGAVAAVTVFMPDGEERELWRAEKVGPIGEPGRVLKIDLPLGFLFERMRLKIASDAVPSWNEIDAVGIRDAKGVMHWAARAEASSTYADVTGARAAGGVVVLPAAAAPAPLHARAKPAAAEEKAARDARIAAIERRLAVLDAELKALRAELAELRTK